MINIYLSAGSEDLPDYIVSRHHESHRLPVGVGTNGVVMEVPRFPIQESIVMAA